MACGRSSWPFCFLGRSSSDCALEEDDNGLMLFPTILADAAAGAGWEVLGKVGGGCLSVTEGTEGGMDNPEAESVSCLEELVHSLLDKLVGGGGSCFGSTAGAGTVLVTLLAGLLCGFGKVGGGADFEWLVWVGDAADVL